MLSLIYIVDLTHSVLVRAVLQKNIWLFSLGTEVPSNSSVEPITSMLRNIVAQDSVRFGP